MGSRVRVVDHYGSRSVAEPFVAGSSLDDLNDDGEAGQASDCMGGIGVGAAEDGLVNDDSDSAAVQECIRNSFRSALPLHDVEIKHDSESLENSGQLNRPYNVLTIDDVSPIDSARERFLQIVVDHFIIDHVVEVTEPEVEYAVQAGQDKLFKRKSREVQYEGDPRFSLPLMYVANLYETLVSDANIRLASISGIRDKTIGVALEAAGGLYRKLAKKFPKKGPCSFRRRELATSVETRARFPELVIQEEKRVRFVVVNGLDINERPIELPVEDAVWFKRLTGRSEVAVGPRDYKFYSPRHKFRRTASNSVSDISDFPSFHGGDESSETSVEGFRTISEAQDHQQTPKHHMQQLSHQPQFHAIQETLHQSMHQPQNISHFPSPNLSDITHAHSQTLAPHVACLQPPSGGHVGGRLLVMASAPAKYCDECGSQYLRETSKFCSECGMKRLGM